MLGTGSGLWNNVAASSGGGAPAFPTADNFNGASMDATKWTTGCFFHDAAPTDAVGVTVAQTSGQLQVTGPTSTTGEHFSGYISTASGDMTGLSVFASVVNTTGSLGNQVAYIGFGSSATNGYLTTISDGTIQLWNNRTSAVIGTGPVWSPTTHKWLRLRHGGAGDDKMYVDAASSSASNPPAPGDWTNIIAGVVRDVSNPITSCEIGIGAGTYTSTATPKTWLFDSINTGT